MKKYDFRASEWEGLPAPVKSFLQGDALWNAYLTPRGTLKTDIEKTLKTRSFTEDARRRLVAAVKNQKAGNAGALALAARLENPKCFAITTGHQPVLMGGPLFFWYKILGAITLAAHCRSWFPEYDFVPIFWLAGEDHDLAEVFTFYGPDEQFHRFVPPDNFAGAAGRYPSAPIHAWLSRELAKQTVFTIQPWFPIFEKYYRKGPSLAEATLAILDELFVEAGLLTINPDDRELKEAFLPYFERELVTSFVKKGLQESALFFARHGFKQQIQGRDLNLFRLDSVHRLPLEKTEEGGFRAGDKIFSLRDLLENPENLSPNVALRPLYQEAVLPSVAYVGGPAEVHYWLQLQPVFDEAGFIMPSLVLRPMAAFLPFRLAFLLEKEWLKPRELLKSKEEKLRLLSAQEESARQSLQNDADIVRAALRRMRFTLSLADSALEKSAHAALARFEHLLERLEHLGYRSWKKRNEALVRQIHELHAILYPQGTFQERRFSIWNTAFLQNEVGLLTLFRDYDEEKMFLFFGETQQK